MRASRKALTSKAAKLLLLVPLLACVASATTHFVDVGLNAEFADRDTGSLSNFNAPATTFILPGDTVVWEFHFGSAHTTTSGPCFAQTASCVADGLWDSQLQIGGGTFSRTFNTVGVFPYFCKFHGFFFAQGQVVVLAQPTFEIKLGTPFSSGEVTTGWAGTTVPFTGTVFGRGGFNSPVTLTCSNGSPRLPNRCPSGPITVIPTVSGTPFIFPTADNSAGAFNFDLVARAADPAQTTHTRRLTLNLVEYGVNLTSPNAVTVVSQGASFPITFEVMADANSPFAISVSFRCTGLSPAVNCLILRNGTIFSEFFGIFLQPGIPEDFSVIVLAGSAAGPGLQNGKLEVRSNSFFNGTTAVVRSRNFSVTVIGPVTHFNVDAPDVSPPGTTFPFVLTARDVIDQVVINYGGTVHFSSSDPAATLPGDYTFVTAPVPENGSHSFPIKLNTVGPRTITVTDTATGMTLTKFIFVRSLSPNNTVSINVSSQPAFFRNGSVTFNAVVSGTGPSPTGKVRFFEGLIEVGTATLVPAGSGSASATLTTGMRPGGHSVIAVYEGDANYGANLSTAVSKSRSPAPRCVDNVCPDAH